MEAFAFYLLKSAAWLSGFAVIYLIFLRKERFFMLKRIYLILGIIVSFIFPLITIHYQVEIPSPPVFREELLPSAYSQSSPAHAATAATPGFNFWLLAGVVYLSGIIILIARSIWQISRLFWSIKRAKADILGPVRVIRASEYLSSFSFFNYVFVNPLVSGNEVEEIMNHELVHVKQKHWFDLVLGELLRLLQWANPFAWIYTGFIRLNHEYLADEEALQRTSDPAVYKATLINQIFRSPVINLTNSFNYSITKTRFDMMKKIIISPYRKLRILLVLPVFAIVFYAFAKPEYHYITLPEETMTIRVSEPIQASEPILSSEPIQASEPMLSVEPIQASESILTSEQIQASEPIQNSVKGKVLKEDGSALPGVAVVVSGTSQGAITDVNGNFAISEVQRNAIFTFSLKGYFTQSIEPKLGKDIEVRMKKDPDYKEEITVIGYGNTPGRAGSINFRNSNTGISPDVVVIIDGKRTNRKGLYGIEPSSIESISVLKDQSATKVYGDDGKYGVIIITSKKNQVIRGVVVDEEEGKPLQNVNITTTGALGSAKGVSTDEKGRFFISNVQSDASLLFSLRGYKELTLKPDFSQEMKVTMVRDPEYKEPD